MSSVLSITGATQRDIENWISRLALATVYEQAGRGRARNFSRENVLELAFLAALMDGGVQALPLAAAYAATFLRHVEIGGVPKWFVFAAGDPSTGFAADTLNDELFGRFSLQGRPAVITAINMKEIVARVDEYFG
jgi:hypothetical protein